MTYLHDLRQDPIYSRQRMQLVTLDDTTLGQRGVVPVVPVSNANSISCVKHHDELFPCQYFVRSRPQQAIRLAISDTNLEDWEAYAPNPYTNLTITFVFFRLFSNFWNRYNSTTFYETRVYDLCLYDEVDTPLLMHGVDYIRAIMQDHRETRSVYNHCCRDANKMLTALGAHSDQLIAELDEEIAQQTA